MLGTGAAAADVDLELRLPARPAELKRARDWVAAAAAEFGFGRKDCFDLVFAVNEAVTNAIKHGSPDEDGMIALAIETDGPAMICSVRDSGPFLPADPVRAAEADESGRGFAFMSALTDEFELLVEADATVVRLRKLLSDEALVADA